MNWEPVWAVVAGVLFIREASGGALVNARTKIDTTAATHLHGQQELP